MGLVDYDDSGSDSDTTTQVVKTPVSTKSKFVDSSIPSFDKVNVESFKPEDIEKINAPFEFGDRGHTWRQIKIEAFAENLSRGIHSLNSMVHEEYPDFISYDGKFTKEDRIKVLNQYSTIWDIAFILLEVKYLSSPANLTMSVLKKRDELLKLRFK